MQFRGFSFFFNYWNLGQIFNLCSKNNQDAVENVNKTCQMLKSQMFYHFMKSRSFYISWWQLVSENLK